MNVGIIGCGPMGSALGTLWAFHGHKVCFSYSRHASTPPALARSAGPNAGAGTPTEAAEFGQIVLLAVPWRLTPAILDQTGHLLSGKTVLTCVLPWNADRSGLVLGTTTSAAEQIAEQICSAQVVEALPIPADALGVTSGLFGADYPTVFYCGNSPDAKAHVADLWEDGGVELVDAGDIRSARFLEPVAALLWHLGVGMGAGTDIAVKLLLPNQSGAAPITGCDQTLRW